jgi:hypothetical protein
MHFYNRKGILTLSMVALFLLFTTIPATAISIKVDFTVDNFKPSGLISGVAPFDLVKGTVIFEGNQGKNLIRSLTMIDLTIGGHTYSLDEIGFLTQFTTETRQIIGALDSGVNVLESQKDDFFLNFDWDKKILSPLYFQYTTSLVKGFWYSTSFSSFSAAPVDHVPVPEPAPLILFCSGLMALWGFRRKFGR